MGGMKVYDGPKVFLNGEPADHEGYVRSNKYGSFKLVDRYVFSAANFNSGRFQGQSAVSTLPPQPCRGGYTIFIKQTTNVFRRRQ